MKSKILVTGASGFIGSRLSTFLANKYDLKFISRTNQPFGETLNFNDFIEERFDKIFFEDVSIIIHLTSIAHLTNIPSIQEMNRVSFEFTQKLMQALNYSKIEKIIYLSSVAVSLLERGVETDTSLYGYSKKKTEELLKDFHLNNGGNFQLTILRPPLIYGINAPGNFSKLFKMLNKKILLPFGSFKNKRSFLAIDNLICGISAIIETPMVKNCKVYEISDPWICTLSSFMKDFKHATKSSAIIIPFPPFLLRFLLSMIGKASIFDKLAIELTVDNVEFRKDFNWAPAFSNQIEAFKKCF